MTDLFDTGKVPLGANFLPHVVTHLLGSSDQWNWEGMLVRSVQLEPPEEPLFFHTGYDVVIFRAQGTIDIQRQVNGRKEQKRSYAGEISLEPKEESPTYYWTGSPTTNLHLYLIHRIADGRIVEQWSQFDLAGALQQLGVFPLPRE